MGFHSRRGAVTTGGESYARSAVLPQLRADLVRLHETGGRADEDTQQRALTGAGARARPAVEQRGLRPGFQLPAGLTDESKE